MNVTLQEAILRLIEVFFCDIPESYINYISIVVTVAIMGGLLAFFVSIFSQRKNSAKIIILVVIIAISLLFVINGYFDAKLVFESELSKLGIGV